ncbi:conserved exported hypothetical protein [Paraburkholderia tropica]|uniref:hypothetical protein n=1 Tax=Paraburkholderia tropica TaxID=92647 RepID=UPI001CAD0AE7|nr:hypothetical protein [Paraburkholderia tropica]CAG9232313.1 conserved exported hypothetical protein [Paraburkholderia tropica]
MKSRIATTAVVLAVVGAMIAGSVMAQQPAPANPEQAQAAATHNDPIVQKRMEIRDANREQRSKNADAKKAYKSEVKQARGERNQAAQESHARAQDALNTSTAPNGAAPVSPNTQ